MTPSSRFFSEKASWPLPLCLVPCREQYFPFAQPLPAGRKPPGPRSNLGRISRDRLPLVTPADPARAAFFCCQTRLSARSGWRPLSQRSRILLPHDPPDCQFWRSGSAKRKNKRVYKHHPSEHLKYHQPQPFALGGTFRRARVWGHLSSSRHVR